MGNKNSHIHLLIETSLKNKLKYSAEKESVSLAEYCRSRLKENYQLNRIEEKINMLLARNPKFDLNHMAFERLKQCKSKNNIINFKNIWSKLCTNFSITKEDCWRLLRDFEKEKKIKFVRGHGIKIITGFYDNR